MDSDQRLIDMWVYNKPNEPFKILTEEDAQKLRTAEKGELSYTFTPGGGIDNGA